MVIKVSQIFCSTWIRLLSRVAVGKQREEQRTTMRRATEVILASAGRALALQRADGSFPQGHNGPWNDVDTPARVTAHWLVLLTTAYRQTPDDGFKAAALRAADFLASPALRPGHATFHCCISDNPWQASNGLI